MKQLAMDGEAVVTPDLFGFLSPFEGEELLRVHTGDRAVKNEERTSAVLADYLTGLPVREVCKRHRIGHNTLSALIERHPEVVDTERKRTLQRLGRVQRLLLDRLEMESHRIPLQCLPVTLGIITDKHLLLSGQATSIVEHRVEVSVESVVEEVRRVKEGIAMERAPGALQAAATGMELRVTERQVIEVESDSSDGQSEVSKHK